MIEKECAGCGAVFYKKVAESNPTWQGRKYCSVDCAAKYKDYSKRPQWNPNWHSTETIVCACGCGTEIPKYDNRGRKRKFAHNHVNIGRSRPKTPEQIEKQRKSLRDGGKVKGKNHPNWKGGISEPMRALRRTEQYDNWRFAVYKRDHYTCQYCGKHCESNNIVAHHLEDFRHNPELRYDTNNGITLCRGCHINLHKGYISLQTKLLISTI